MPQYKILVVDDEVKILRYVADFLAQQGYSVLTAANSSAAIKHAQVQKPDLIIMDVLLQDQNGAEVYQMIQKLYASQKIPVVFLTGIITKDEEEGVLPINIDGQEYPTLAKPFNSDQLAAIVRNTLLIS